MKKVYFRLMFGDRVVGAVNDAVDLQVSFFVIKNIMCIKKDAKMVFFSVGSDVH